MATVVGYNFDEDKTFIIHTNGTVSKAEASRLILARNMVENGRLAPSEEATISAKELTNRFSHEALSLVAIFDENVNATMVPQRK